MEQHVSGNVYFSFDTHEEMLEFVKIFSETNWNEYKKAQMKSVLGDTNRKLTRKESHFVDDLNQKVSIFNAFGINSTDEELADKNCVEVALFFEYDFEVYVDGKYVPATMWDSAIAPELEEVQDFMDILNIIKDLMSAIGCENLDYDYNAEDIELESEEDLWNKYEQEKDFNPYDDY